MKRTTLEVIAPTVEEAIARGVEQLGVPRELLDVDVLDEGSKGFLGIGGRQVRLRLTLKGAETSSQMETDSQSAPVLKAGAEPAAPPDDSLLNFTIQTTSDLLSKMKIKAQVSAKYGESDGTGEAAPVLIDINGDDLSVLIGRRAETLNALQYILALIISKEANHWVQVSVDVEGYRARRERQLRQLARRMAEQAIRTGKRQLLEPMSSAERRIVHLELRDHDTVTTESVGEEPNRKVSIILKK
jgi:spoIIIJ-associated protein